MDWSAGNEQFSRDVFGVYAVNPPEGSIYLSPKSLLYEDICHYIAVEGRGEVCVPHPLEFHRNAFAC
jgi:hypothetical protein